MTDPADCGPVTLAFCQDVQAEAYDWPAEFFAPKEWHRRRPRPGLREVKVAADADPRRAAAADHRRRRRALCRGDRRRCKAFAEKHNIPVGETQAGKSSLPWDHPLNLGSIGVTGSSATNAVAAEADVVIGVGTRLQDFTTGSWSLFQGENRRIVSINVTPYDTHKHNALPLVADARLALDEISGLLGDHRAPDVDAGAQGRLDRGGRRGHRRADRQRAADRHAGDRRGPARRCPTTRSWSAPPAGCRASCTSSGRPARPNGYHLEYGFSTHGLRDRRRPRRQDGPPGPRGRGDGRRRQLHDAELRARDPRDARPEAHRGAARQPRLRLHQPAADRTAAARASTT